MAVILILDDDAQFREMLRQILEKTEHEVLEAPNGREGLKILRKQRVDLIITDILMPEMDGIEFLRELQNNCPDVKTIAISGGGVMASDICLRMAKPFGALRTLKKPFDVQELLKAVDEVLRINHSSD